MKKLVILLVFGLLFGSSIQQVPYKGMLFDKAGAVINDTVDLDFKIYNSTDKSTLLWSETHTGVIVQDGRFSVNLGANTPLQDELINETGLYLLMIVNGEASNEVIPITTGFYSKYTHRAKYALEASTANYAENVKSHSHSDSDIINIDGSKINNDSIVDSKIVTINAAKIIGTILPGPHSSTHAVGGSDELVIAKSQVTNLQSELDSKPNKSNNLSDLDNVATARSNLGLGSLAISNTVSSAQINDLNGAKIDDNSISDEKIITINSSKIVGPVPIAVTAQQVSWANITDVPSSYSITGITLDATVSEVYNASTIHNRSTHALAGLSETKVLRDSAGNDFVALKSIYTKDDNSPGFGGSSYTVEVSSGGSLVEAFRVNNQREFFANSFHGNGANLTNLNANNITAGIFPTARLDTSVSLLGQSIESTEITSIEGDKITGTISNSRLDTAVSLLGQSIEPDEITGFVGSANYALVANTANYIEANIYKDAVVGLVSSLNSYLGQAQNLADLDDVTAARSNLGLGSIAMLNSVSNAEIVSLDGSKINDSSISTSKIVSLDGAKITGIVSTATTANNVDWNSVHNKPSSYEYATLNIKASGATVLETLTVENDNINTNAGIRIQGYFTDGGSNRTLGFAQDIEKSNNTDQSLSTKQVIRLAKNGSLIQVAEINSDGQVVATEFVGSGAGLTNIAASEITGTISNSSLDAELQDLADGSLSGNKIGSGIIADNITTGTLDNSRLDASVSLLGQSIDTDEIVSLNVSKLVGTIPNTLLDAELQDLADGSLSGNKIGSGIIADNITTGTLDSARLDNNLQDLADGSLSGSKIGNGIDGANITDATITDAKIISISGAKVVGTILPGPHASSHSKNGLDEITISKSQVTDLETDLATYAIKSANLADLSNVATARTNLGVGIGTDVQGYDADLTDLADGSLSGDKIGSGIDAGNITTGTLDNTRFDAYSDLTAEGYLDNNSAGDIQTRSQADARYLGITSKASDADTLDGINSSSFLRTDQSDETTGKFTINVDPAGTALTDASLVINNATAAGAEYLIAGLADSIEVFSAKYDGSVVATSFTGSHAGNGSALTDINAANITTGTLDNARLDDDLRDLADGSLTGSKVGLVDEFTNSNETTLQNVIDDLDAAIETNATNIAGKQNSDSDLDDLADGSLTGSKVGLIDEFTYSTATNVQNVIDDLDAAIKTNATNIADKQNSDSDLDDLADGSLTGSKIGPGIAGDNITDETIDSSEIQNNSLVDADINSSAAIAWSKINKSGSGVSDLANVTLSSPADNEVIAYNIGTGTWINQTAAEAGLATSGHNHDGTYLTIAGTAANSTLLDSIDSSSFARSDSDDALSGRITLTKIPSGSGLGQGSLWINPPSATDGYTLFSISVAGSSELFKVDENGAVNAAGIISAPAFSGSGANLTSLPAGQLTGTIDNARLDSDLQDLADGSLSGSLVGSGISAGNITTGNIDNARLDADLQDLADGKLTWSKIDSDGATWTGTGGIDTTGQAIINRNAGSEQISLIHSNNDNGNAGELSEIFKLYDNGNNAHNALRLNIAKVNYQAGSFTTKARIFLMGSNVETEVVEITTENVTNKTGRYKDETGFVMPVGSVIPYAGTTAPEGWLIANGAEINRADYPDLFAVISTIYGGGDGSNTFNLPDPRGRTIVAAGQGVTLTNRTLASTFGSETHVLTIAEMPAHTHTVGYNKNNGVGGGGDDVWRTDIADSITKATGSAGNNDAHNIIQPSFVFNYIIKY